MSKTNNWKAFGSKYLKAENVANNTDKYVITKVDSELENDRETIIFTVERDGISKLFGCNVTNEQAVKEECSESPNQALGKIIVFNKVQVQLPGSNPVKIVDGLRIQFFKDPIKEEKIESNSGIQEDGTI